MKALLTSTLFLLPTARGQEPAGAGDGAALQLARQVTEKGAATFNTKDAQAMAALYTEDAQVSLLGKGEGGYGAKVYRGRDEIEQLYRDVFKDTGEFAAKNEVELARLPQPDLLVIYGTFQVQKGSQTTRLPFFQARVRQGEEWRTASLQLIVVPSQP